MRDGIGGKGGVQDGAECPGKSGQVHRKVAGASTWKCAAHCGINEPGSGISGCSKCEV